MGCEIGHGFPFAKPMPKRQFLATPDRRPAGRSKTPATVQQAL
jgi:sensor c-di-GMP phosphodiesterase-like protein